MNHERLTLGNHPLLAFAAVLLLLVIVGALAQSVLP